MPAIIFMNAFEYILNTHPINVDIINLYETFCQNICFLGMNNRLLVDSWFRTNYPNSMWYFKTDKSGKVYGVSVFFKQEDISTALEFKLRWG